MFQAPPVEAPRPATAEAGSLGSINGTVIDSSGAVVVGAHVALTREDQLALTHEATSGDDGQFSFANLAAGAFQVRISAPGFAEQTSSVTLHAGEFYILPTITLALAVMDTEISVSARPAEVAEEQLRVQEKQRVLGVVPNFYVSYIPNAAPLDAGQKVRLAWKSIIDPVSVGITALTAGVQQAQNVFPAYGQGAAGYAKRFGASFTDDATSTLIGGAILPALLKQDPRYFYKGTGSTRSRFFYAIANAVICKGDNGRWQPNYSAILGGLASGGISNLYYPKQDRGAGLVFENTAIGTGETALFNVLQEFVIRRWTPHVPPEAPHER